jgi:NADH-quinone oxidoreductase subunit L
MVTAGVYMIGRNAVLFGHAPHTLDVVAVIGCVTALMAGTIGLVQNDIKRVLAYSTVSQLGYMFLAMGVGAFAGGIFHLYTHAFFKALLFLGSGAVIHALHGEQDLRHMGGLRKELPITYWTFLIGTLAIAGVPLLSGFFSKDEILWQTYASGHTILWGVAVITAFLTATYMFRLLYLAFFGERRQAPGHGPQAPDAHGHASHLHDAPPAMAAALVVLALGSILAGYVGLPNVIGRRQPDRTFLEPSFEAPGGPAERVAAAAEHPPEEHGADRDEPDARLDARRVAASASRRTLSQQAAGGRRGGCAVRGRPPAAARQVLRG